jgi:FkbM family methyltransferase
MRTFRPAGVGKSADDTNYRPFIELECLLCKRLFAHESMISPIAMADVGARGDPDPFWSVFDKNSKTYCFEPEVAEAARLERQFEGSSVTIFPIGLAAAPGEKTLYVTRDLGASSVLRPNKDFVGRLPDPSSMDIIDQQTIKVDTLDNCLHQANVPYLDIIKMDTQGSELDILSGAERFLKEGVLAVIAETWFMELYQHQALFSEMDVFLRNRGFVLFDIDIRRWRKRNLPATFDKMRIGQTIYADVVYLKDPIGFPDKFAINGPIRDNLLKLAAIAERLSVPDYALEIVEFAGKAGLISSAEEEEFSTLLRANSIIRYNDRRLVPPFFSSTRPFIRNADE